MTFQARFILAKIKGEILIENKRKAAIVNQLVKMGFEPDPVKQWKVLQKKRELEMTGEVQVDEEEMEGEEEVCFLLKYAIFTKKFVRICISIEIFQIIAMMGGASVLPSTFSHLHVVRVLYISSIFVFICFFFSDFHGKGRNLMHTFVKEIIFATTFFASRNKLSLTEKFCDVFSDLLFKEESEPSASPINKDLEKKLSDYDYLVGMAILKLSEEEKDKLLRESELKLEELKVNLQSLFLLFFVHNRDIQVWVN